jgi:Ca2+-binding EF-hand superfamily protein
LAIAVESSPKLWHNGCQAFRTTNRESTMANDKEKQELVEKVSALVESTYAGDWYRAFMHYAAKRGGSSDVDKDELKEMLSDAGVGNRVTRGGWASAIMDEMDTDKNSSISWEEFEAMMKGNELQKK